MKSLQENFLKSTYEHAYITFALNYLSFPALDEKHPLYCYQTQLRSICERFLLEGEQRVTILEVEIFRNQISEALTQTMIYYERFLFYEYVLNRIEHRFSEMKLPSNYSDEAFLNQIMKYIIEEDTNNEERITLSSYSEVLEQLPIRFTKTKFLELIKDAMSIYQGGDTDSIDKTIDFMRSSALLETPNPSSVAFIRYEKDYQQLSNIDFKEISKDTFEKQLAILKHASKEIDEEVDQFYFLAELINSMYVILIVQSLLEVENVKAINACRSVIAYKNSHFAEDFESNPLVIKYLDQITERSEKTIYKFRQFESKMIDEIESEETVEQIDEIIKIIKLMSVSRFICLEEEAEVTIADEAYINDAYEKIATDLMEKFQSVSKIERRAIMSRLLHLMPPFLRTKEEIQVYIMTSLSNCRDVAEKLACYEIIQELINQ